MGAQVFYADSSELATLSNTFSVNSVATDPTTVSLMVVAPDGTSTTYTYALAEITKTGTGVYEKDIPCSQQGRWHYVWYGTGTASDVVAGSWDVFQAPADNVYAALAELKEARRITDLAEDGTLMLRLQRASRAIDRRCGRYFYLDTAVSQREYRVKSRVVRDDDGELLMVDDIGTDTGLVVEVGDGTTWTVVPSTDYSTEPENALARGMPITGFRRDLGYWRGAGLFSARRARITARWGWPQVPADIREAAWLLANRRYFRSHSPEGVAGRDSDGAIRISRFDPDIEDLVESYVLAGFA